MLTGTVVPQTFFGLSLLNILATVLTPWINPFPMLSIILGGRIWIDVFKFGVANGMLAHAGAL